ncbi:hypothetical protein CSUB8523_1765 [Campylobacter subantarcticus LMG 24377]|uniref:Uncharacterized protein n=1 Tax=Campylobacter subantarcticus TaxID=497724 RepID=A0ABW9N2Q6_9BACT|nr:hypothetical protein [Campylobacter subantarcticus]AJC93245.1 hypothetical protein CSUB8523_1765 [Campylobacter subantarcticus LMG 24377]EAL3939608.1 hypothetical protein [Campylobacter lari]MPB98564.1 hypothetical protein [Campylobacter subantarcticus]
MFNLCEKGEALYSSYFVYNDFKKEFLELFKYKSKKNKPTIKLPKINKEKFYTNALERLESFLKSFNAISKGFLEEDIADFKDDVKHLQESKEIYIKTLMLCELVRFFEIKINLRFKEVLE